MASSYRNQNFFKSSSQYNRILHHRVLSRRLARESTARYTLALVGSGASGLNIPDSDYDVLIEPRNIIIDESSLVYRRDLPCFVRIPTNRLAGDVPRVLLNNDKFMRADPLRDISEQIFGNSSFRGSTGQYSKVGEVLTGWTQNTTDLVPQIRISGLPSVAHPFVSRDRSWPPTEIVSLISNGEFHIAARPAPVNPDPLHDYCLSFSKAEVVLIRTMSVNQVVSIKCLKRISKCIDAGNGTLTSYHMKTAAFWHYEQTKPQDWIIDRPFVGILTRLDRYLNEKFLPHYFVPDMNLLAGVSESTLIDIRRRLWSFLGFYLIADDIVGMKSSTKLFLARSMVDKVLFQFKFSVWADAHCSITNPLRAAETMYGVAGNFPLKVMKQYVIESVMRIFPTFCLIYGHMSNVERLRALFNDAIDGRVRSTYLEDKPGLNHKLFIMWIDGIIKTKTTVEPLVENFGFNTRVHNRSNSRGVSLQHVEDTMKKWLAFTDNIKGRLKSHGNNISDLMLRRTSLGSRDETHTDTGCGKHRIDSLADHVTKELLSFAVDNIEAVFSSMSTGVNLFRPAAVDDSLANIHILHDAVDRWFMHVEYAIVMSIRLKGSAGTFDQTKEVLDRILCQTGVESQCFVAPHILYTALQYFEDICIELHGFHGWTALL